MTPTELFAVYVLACLAGAAFAFARVLEEDTREKPLVEQLDEDGGRQ